MHKLHKHINYASAKYKHPILKPAAKTLQPDAKVTVTVEHRTKTFPFLEAHIRAAIEQVGQRKNAKTFFFPSKPAQQNDKLEEMCTYSLQAE